MPGWNESAWFSFLVGVALKSIVVLGAAWLAAFCLRGRSAAARHLVWTAAFGALLALPLLSVAVPALPVPGTGAVFSSQAVFQAGTGVAAEVAQPAGLGDPAPKAGLDADRGTGGLPHTDWRAAAMLAWALGAAALYLQMLSGLAHMQRLRARARSLPGGDLPELAGALGIRQGVSAFETAPGRMPMSFGILRPAVFMPADSAEWSEERRRVVLLHELAHVRRGDHAKHLLARAALCLYWWNPLVWLAWRAFLRERERAADDLVLAAGARASDYAAHLLEIARAMRSGAALGAAAVAVARRSQLEGRLLAILDSARNRTAPGRVGALAAALVCAAIVVPLAALQAQDSPQALPADLDGAIRAALAERNHQTLEDLAKTAEAQLRYDLAQRLIESAVALNEQTSGPNSVEYGKELVRLGDVQRKRGDLQAHETYKKAIAILGSDPAAGPALIALGVTAVNTKRYEEAFDYFQRAQTSAPAQAAEAAMWQAVVRERQSRDADADSLYKLALSLSTPDTSGQATILELYANLLRRLNRPDEAADMSARAMKVRAAIPPRTAQFQAGPAQQERTADALRSPVIISTGIGLSSGSAGNRTAPPPPPPPPTADGAATPANGVYRVGGGVTAPTLVSKVEPAYTEQARAAGLQGTVVLYIEVDPTGRAYNIRVQRSLGLGLDETAIEAVRQWRFTPGKKDGKPVTVAATIEVNFRSQQFASGETIVNSIQTSRTDGLTTPPKLIRKVEPEYTEQARQARYQGAVVLAIEVGADGVPRNIRVQRSLGMGLDEKAVEAVSRWVFQPAMKDSQPVTAASTIEVNFRLAPDAAVSDGAVGSGVTPAGNGVTAPRILSKVEPAYTDEARAAKYQGSVELSVEVGTDGVPQKIVVKRGLGLGLDEKAVEAVSKWRFQPGTRFGVPVTVAATVQVSFRLL